MQSPNFAASYLCTKTTTAYKKAGIVFINSVQAPGTLRMSK